MTLQIKRIRARKVLQNCTDYVLDNYSDVTGLDIGYREKGGIE